MKIVKIELSKLKPLEKNVRNHSDIQVKEFVRALKQFGQTRPFVLDEEYNILVGNGMYQAMIAAGFKDGDCYIKAGLSELEKKKLIISDNKLFELGQTDYIVTDEFLKELVQAGDSDVPGFEPDVLMSIVSATEQATKVNADYGNVVSTDFQPVEIPPCIPDEEIPAESVPAAMSAPIADHAEIKRTVVCPHCGEQFEI
jgi:hypothetical protein